jgi:beta-lactamase regulating signal transducer with metallopeptidase domain
MTSAQFLDLALSQFIQLSILIVAVSFATKLLCKRRSHLAYILWMLVLVKAMTPPLWSSPLGLFSWAQSQTAPDAQPISLAAPPTSPQASISSRSVPQSFSTPVPQYFSYPIPRYTGGGQVRGSSALPQSDPPAPQPTISTTKPPIPLNLILLELWLSGFFFLLTMTAIKWGFLRRRIERCAISPPPALQGVVEDVCQKLGVRTAINPRVCTEPIGPAVFGFFRPILVLPESVLVDADPDDLRQLLSHEIIHIRRKDPWISALQVVVQSLWWFHPLVWWVNRRIGEVREMCCDSEVIATQRCEAGRYAQMLLDVARSRRATRGFAIMEPALGAGGARLTRTRLEYVMNEKSRLAPRMPAKYWAIFAVASLILLPGAALVRGEPAQPSAPPPTDQSVLAQTSPTQLTPPAATEPARSLVEVPVWQYNQDRQTESLESQRRELEAEIEKLKHEATAATGTELLRLQNQLQALAVKSNALSDYFARSLPRKLTRTRHFVMIVVATDNITFQGDPISLDLLANKLLDVPDPSQTVVQLAYANGDVTMRRFTEVQARVSEIVKRLGFEYLSEAGEHPISTKGDPDQTINSSQAYITFLNPPTPWNGLTGVGQVQLSSPTITINADPFTVVQPLTPAPDSDLTHNVKFQLGKTEFSNGDEIVITEVRGNSDQFHVDGTYQVKGTYRLASADKATLVLELSSKDRANAYGSWGKQQLVEITRGSGTFTLTDRFPIEGFPHIKMYAGKSGSADLYFGAGQWLLTDAKRP